MPALYLLNMWALYSFALFLVGFFLSTYSANLFPVLVINTVMLASFAYSLTISAIAAGRRRRLPSDSAAGP
jgi:ABC-type transport system involved in multi-copper enzyme maturation permease subunit